VISGVVYWLGFEYLFVECFPIVKRCSITQTGWPRSSDLVVSGFRLRHRLLIILLSFLIWAWDHIFIFSNHCCLHSLFCRLWCNFALLDPTLAHFTVERVQFTFQMVGPLGLWSRDWFERLNIRVVKCVGQSLLTVSALFEFCLSDSGNFSEISIPVEDLMHLVFDFCLKIKILKQFRDCFLNLMACWILPRTELFGVLAVRLN